MKKVIIKAIVLAVSFILIWIALAQLDWVKLFRIEELSNKSEEKIGDIFHNYIIQSESVARDQEITTPVKNLVKDICTANGIKAEEIRVYILKDKQVNAFAMPGKQLVIYSGLIDESSNQYELAGVIAHELAHIKLGHVKKKLIKEVGLSTLLSVSGGVTGAELAKEMMKLLSSTAYDRKLEEEADSRAVSFLINTGVNPAYLADFLERLSKKESPGQKYLSWISDHPDTKERIDYIRRTISNRYTKNKILINSNGWKTLKKKIQELNN
ncbi:MAG: M48 family metallopeptidase [Ignavibacteriaceae bacterium]|nr:M48 family metallopeptidase [Ignavibacteriaceae bacterium]